MGLLGMGKVERAKGKEKVVGNKIRKIDGLAIARIQNGLAMSADWSITTQMLHDVGSAQLQESKTSSSPKSKKNQKPRTAPFRASRTSSKPQRAEQLEAHQETVPTAQQEQQAVAKIHHMLVLYRHWFHRQSPRLQHRYHHSITPLSRSM